MKNAIIILGMLLAVTSQAANNKALDTIYANDHMNMALFFPSNIKQGIVGNNNFVFTYNREKGQTLGLLKAFPGKDSNLLVITDDGSVYSYMVRYAKKLEYPNKFIALQERIGTEKRDVGEKVSQTGPSKERVWDSLIKHTKAERKFQKSCEALLQLPERRNVRKKSQGLSLAVKNLYPVEDEVYVQFELENSSGVKFDFGNLELFKASGRKGRRASYQELELLPLYRYASPNSVMHGQKARFVYVYPKFHLDKGERLKVNLSEAGTSRLVVLTFK
ncbi:MAG: conjugative transposon protein TraN [Flavobacteriaceae bacterium]|nr:conjugative transposon protein TraN [Flavobacteriaceae bacterium]